ncbi:hypothetical protein [Vibrio sinaloensis]|uniref:hypothetical protein n=1 Tax=Photobacterium sp. (strain ATCC 43367) TaxID=379097 RepID=UPI002F408324
MRVINIATALCAFSSVASANSIEPNWQQVNLQSNLFAQFGYYQTSREEPYSVPGVITDAHVSHHEQGLQLMHGELGLLASLDQILAAKLVVGSHHGEAIEIEELWLQPYLHQNWTLRIGRQLSPIGLYNATHEHDWSFLDPTLAQQAFLANQYQDDSVHVTYATNRQDLTLWLGRGDQFPAQADSASPAAFGALYQWYQLRSQYQLTLVASAAQFTAQQRSNQQDDGHSHQHTSQTSPMTFTGDTQLVSLSSQLKWQQLTWDVEWMGQRLDANLVDSQQINTELSAFQQGLSSQLRWQNDQLELGLRYDWLHTDNRVTNTSRDFEQALDAKGLTPQRYSAVVNWRFAPMQLLRLQANYEQIDEQNQTTFWLVYQGNLTW